MSDRNQNMDDFIKKRLNDLGSAGDWDRPRPLVRDRVLTQIVPVKSDRKKNFVWLWLLALGLFAGLSTISLSRHYKNKIASISQIHQAELDGRMTIIDKLNVDLNNEKEKLLAERKTWRFVLDSTQNAIRELNNSAQSGASLRRQQRSIMTQLNLESLLWENKFRDFKAQNQPLIHPVGEQYDRLSLIKREDVEKELNLNQRQESPEFMMPTLPYTQLEMPKFNFGKNKYKNYIMPFTKSRSKLKLGYDFAIKQVDLSTEKSFEQQRLASDGLQIKSALAYSHGLYMAYSPKPRWWIRSGISRSNLSLQYQSRLGIGYNTDGEFNRPDASKGNVLLLHTETSFTEIESQIEIINPRGRELQTGDLIELSIQEELDLNVISLPLGLEYETGYGQFNWLAQLGMMWNRIDYTRYNIQVEGVANIGGIPIYKSDVNAANIPSSDYISLYGGIGLEYRIFSNWFVQPTLLGHYNFSEQLSATKTSIGLQVSMGYKF